MSEIERCLQRAARERNLANMVISGASHDTHVMLAERWLDRAWSLNEADDARPPLDVAIWR